jgi:hypothetical protein
MNLQNSSRIYKIPLLVPIPTQINPDHEVSSYFFKIDFNVILLSHNYTKQYIYLRSSKLLWLSDILFR